MLPAGSGQHAIFIYSQPAGLGLPVTKGCAFYGNWCVWLHMGLSAVQEFPPDIAEGSVLPLVPQLDQQAFQQIRGGGVHE